MNDSERTAGCEAAVSVCPTSRSIATEEHRFKYDMVYGPMSTQGDVYREQGVPMVQGFVEGLNTSILAYGQTGSGKTYTMGSSFAPGGDDATLGLIPRVVSDVLRIVDSRAEQWDSKVTISYLEIYNEHVRDLLRPDEQAPPKRGYVLQKDRWGNYVARGLTERPLSSLADLSEALAYGAERRTTAATNMNATSSRSHAIVTIRLEQDPVEVEAEAVEAEAAQAAGAAAGAEVDTAASPTSLRDRRVSLFRLVDLAGSERSKQTGAEGKRLVEANNINLSLSTLGRCINALASKSKHVPFRNSKLTQLLTNSLGGNSKTLMIACVSPADVNLEQTVQTLKYASTAANITNRPTVNADQTAVSNTQLRRQNKALRDELRRLHAAGSGSIQLRPEVLELLGLGAAATSAAAGGAGAAGAAGAGSWEDRAVSGSNGYNLTGALAAAEAQQARSKLLEAEAEAAYLSDQCDALRQELQDIGERGTWAAQQAASLLDENVRLQKRCDTWEWRARTVCTAAGIDLSAVDQAPRGAAATAGDEQEQQEEEEGTGAAGKQQGGATGLQVAQAPSAAQLEAAGERVALSMLEAAREAAPGAATAGPGAPKAIPAPAAGQASAGVAAGDDGDDAGMEGDGGEDDDEVGGGDGSARTTELDLAHLRSQVALRSRLQDISATIQQKEAKYAAEASQHAHTVNDFDQIREKFHAEMHRSNQEVTQLLARVQELEQELEAARASKPASKASKGADPALARKDKELVELRRRIKGMQDGMERAKREHRRREQLVAKLARMRADIDTTKRDRVQVEKRMREAAKKYAAERKQLIQERSQAGRRERQAAVALQRAKQQLEAKVRQLEASRQKERARKAQEAVQRRNKASARSVRGGRRAATTHAADTKHAAAARRAVQDLRKQLRAAESIMSEYTGEAAERAEEVAQLQADKRRLQARVSALERRLAQAGGIADDQVQVVAAKAVAAAAGAAAEEPMDEEEAEEKEVELGRMRRPASLDLSAMPSFEEINSTLANQPPKSTASVGAAVSARLTSPQPEASPTTLHGLIRTANTGRHSHQPASTAGAAAGQGRDRLARRQPSKQAGRPRAKSQAATVAPAAPAEAGAALQVEAEEAVGATEQVGVVAAATGQDETAGRAEADAEEEAEAELDDEFAVEVAAVETADQVEAGEEAQAAEDDDDEDEFKDGGAGRAQLMDGSRAGPNMARQHSVYQANPVTAIEGRFVRQRKSKYVAPKGFGSSTARHAPDHIHRVEEMRLAAHRRAQRLKRKDSGGTAAVAAAAAPDPASAAPPRPPQAEAPSARSDAEPATAAASSPVPAGGRTSRARLARFMSGRGAAAANGEPSAGVGGKRRKMDQADDSAGPEVPVLGASSASNAAATHGSQEKAGVARRSRPKRSRGRAGSQL